MTDVSDMIFLTRFWGNIKSCELFKTTGTEMYNNSCITEAAEISSPPLCVFEVMVAS